MIKVEHVEIRHDAPKSMPYIVWTSENFARFAGIMTIVMTTVLPDPVNSIQDQVSRTQYSKIIIRN